MFPKLWEGGFRAVPPGVRTGTAPPGRGARPTWPDPLGGRGGDDARPTGDVQAALAGGDARRVEQERGPLGEEGGDEARLVRLRQLRRELKGLARAFGGAPVRGAPAALVCAPVRGARSGGT